MTYENWVNPHNKYVYLLATVQLGLQMTFGHTKTSLGIFTPVPGTENDAKPSYYADEVAVIGETLTTCENSIKRLNNIRKKVNDEIFKTKAALAVLQLGEATKQGAVTSIIDSIALYLNKALPNLDKCKIPLYWLRWCENMDITTL